ncbi:unnamed protein product, partial [Arabidopsis halleri]
MTHGLFSLKGRLGYRCFPNLVLYLSATYRLYLFRQKPPPPTFERLLHTSYIFRFRR